MLCYTDHPPPRVLPVRALLATLLACLGASYWLVPSDSEMVDRLMLDQQYERVATLLNAGKDPDGKVKASLARELSAEQLASLSQLLRLTPREQLNAIFAAARPPAYDRFLHALAVSAVRYVNVIPPDEAWQLISRHAEHLSAGQFMEFTTLLSRNALALRQPALAARILDRACAIPGAGVQTATDMAQAYRWSSQPGLGATRLHQWLQAHQANIDEEAIIRLRELNAALALEGGQPGMALDLCLDSLRALPQDEPLQAAQIEKALSLAGQCSRTADLIPWLRRFVADMPETRLSLKDLRRQALAKPGSLATYVKWATLLAHFTDWNSEYETSFDQHLRLAAAGSLDSLDRCVALWSFLGAGEELAGVLVELGDVPQRPQLRTVLAGLLASLGRDAEAAPLYRQYLADHPDDRDAHYKLACLFEDMGDEDSSLAALNELVKRFPNDVPAVKKLAAGDIRARRFAEALRLYARLPEASHDYFTRENYGLIAESLGDHENLFKAQHLAARATTPPTAERYLDMSETVGYLPHPEQGVAAIEEGLARMPQSAAIRVALADLYTTQEDPARAWAVLNHPCVKASYEGITRILDLAPALPHPQDLLAFVGKDVETRFQFPPSARLDLAVLHALCGQKDKAEALFASVPATPATFALIAQARFTIGAYEDAAGLMERHIALKNHVTSDDHVFLGDLYELLGREEDAKNAYSASIDVITRRPLQSAFRPSATPPIARQH